LTCTSAVDSLVEGIDNRFRRTLDIGLDHHVEDIDLAGLKLLVEISSMTERRLVTGSDSSRVLASAGTGRFRGPCAHQ
jgi:hypothetical protein